MRRERGRRAATSGATTFCRDTFVCLAAVLWVAGAAAGETISAPAAEPLQATDPALAEVPLVAPEGLEHAGGAQPEHELPLPDLADEPADPVLTLEPAGEVTNHPPVVSLPLWEPPGIDEGSPPETPVDVEPSDPAIESLRAEDAL